MKKIIILNLILIILCGCRENNDSQRSYSADLFSMDTYISLRAYGENSETAIEKASDEIKRLEKIFSVTDTESDIYKINEFGTAEVSGDTIDIINKAIKISEKTGGALDITIYPVLKLWGFTSGDYKIPEREDIDELLENVNFRGIEISGKQVSVPENFKIDLGAVAKGYASDKVIEIFRENNIESAVISLGGNVYAMGKKQDNSLWNVAIRNPFAPDENIGVLSVSDKAVITSGNYERFFTGNDGKKYCHIIDCESGYPVDNGVSSVTVTGENGTECDSLSTALFVMGKDKAFEYWRNNNKDFDMIIITDEPKIYITENISGNFKNISNFDLEIVSIE